MLTLKGKTKKLKWNFQRDWGVETNKPLWGRVRIFFGTKQCQKRRKKELGGLCINGKEQVHCISANNEFFVSQENGAFFVMTNMIITPDQTQGKCPEDPNEKDVICKSDSDCQAMEPVKYGHGEFW